MTDEQFFHQIKETIQEFQPKTVVVKKQESKFHRFLSKIMFFVPYMNFSTTLGWTISMAEDHWHRWGVLAHEGKHVIQAQKQTRLVHSLLYAYPQIMAVLGIILPLVLWNAWYLLFFIALLPIPAYMRMSKELDAYSVSVTVRQWRSGVVPMWYVEAIAKNFTGSSYYFMWPFSSWITRKLLDAAHNARHWNEDDVDPYLNAILAKMRLHGMLHPKGIIDG
jgi:hypothetical protein